MRRMRSVAARKSANASPGTGSDTLRIAVSSYLSSWDQDFVGFDPVALMLYKNVFPYMIDYGVTEADGSTTAVGPGCRLASGSAATAPSKTA